MHNHTDANPPPSRIPIATHRHKISSSRRLSEGSENLYMNARMEYQASSDSDYTGSGGTGDSGFGDTTPFLREPLKKPHKYTPLLPEHRETCEGMCVIFYILCWFDESIFSLLQKHYMTPYIKADTYFLSEYTVLCDVYYVFCLSSFYTILLAHNSVQDEHISHAAAVCSTLHCCYVQPQAPHVSCPLYLCIIRCELFE